MWLSRGEFWGLLCVFCCTLVHQSGSAPAAGKATPEDSRAGDKQAAKENESKGTQTIIRPTNVFRTDDLKLDAKGMLNGKEFKRDLRPFEWLYNTLDNYLRCAYSSGADCEQRLVSSIKLGEKNNRLESVTHHEIPKVLLKEFVPRGDGVTPYSAYSPVLPLGPLRDPTVLNWFDKPFSGLWKPAFPMPQGGLSPRGSGYGETSFDPYVPMVPSYYGPNGGSPVSGYSHGPQPWTTHHAFERPFGRPLVTFPHTREPNAGLTPFESPFGVMRKNMDAGNEHGMYNGPWREGIDQPSHFYGNPLPFHMMRMPML